MKAPKGGQVEFLEDNEVKDICDSSFSLLEETGVIFRSSKVLKYFEKSDAEVDRSENRVKIPRRVVEDALNKAPQNFTIYARDPENKVEIEPKRVYFGPMIGRIKILDYKKNKVRDTNLKDVGNLVKLADALDSYSLLHSGAIMPQIKGVSDDVVHLQGYLKSLENSSKVIKASARGERVSRDCLNMAKILAGGEDELKKNPMVYTTVNPVSPLQFPESLLEGLVEYAKLRQPIDIAPEIQAGASGPITLAGVLTQQTAEVMAGITLIQLISPEAPCFYGSCSTIMDMKVGNIALGGIETGMLNVGTAQIARHLGLAVRGSAGDTESKVLDVQSGYERAQNMLLAAMGGINYIFYPGTIETARTVSLEQLLIDDEICGMIYRVLKGIDVNKETIAKDIISKVGPRGDYIGEKHTLEFLEEEQYIPKLSDRHSREDWEEKGGEDLAEVAHRKVGEILDEHEPEPIEEDVHKELREYVESQKP